METEKQSLLDEIQEFNSMLMEEVDSVARRQKEREFDTNARPSMKELQRFKKNLEVSVE